MKSKMVKQYKCDFCGKKNYSASAMNKHEKHCTMNPDRKCRMCDAGGEHKYELKELINMLPEMVAVDKDWGVDIQNLDEIKSAVKALKEKVECPACILAAIRQRGILVYCTEYDYKKEVEVFWADVNECNLREEYHHFLT